MKFHYDIQRNRFISVLGARAVAILTDEKDGEVEEWTEFEETWISAGKYKIADSDFLTLPMSEFRKSVYQKFLKATNKKKKESKRE